MKKKKFTALAVAVFCLSMILGLAIVANAAPTSGAVTKAEPTEELSTLSQEMITSALDQESARLGAVPTKNVIGGVVVQRDEGQNEEVALTSARIDEALKMAEIDTGPAKRFSGMASRAIYDKDDGGRTLAKGWNRGMAHNGSYILIC